MSGAGKSTLGEALAKEIGLPYIDGDSLHSQANIDKMSAGIPLDDDDRGPWLRKIREEAVKACKQHSEGTGVEGDATKRRGLVVGCSALKKSYRRLLRGEDHDQEAAILVEDAPPMHDPFTFATRFVFISGSKDELFKRMKSRKGHYMKEQMLDSQFATLETPDPATEEDIITVDLLDPTPVQVEKAMARLQACA